MSSRKDDSTPTDKDVETPKTVPVEDDSLSIPGRSYSIPTSSYMELHGDVHKGQEPPEEKD